MSLPRGAEIFLQQFDYLKQFTHHNLLSYSCLREYLCESILIYANLINEKYFHRVANKKRDWKVENILTVEMWNFQLTLWCKRRVKLIPIDLSSNVSGFDCFNFSQFSTFIFQSLKFQWQESFFLNSRHEGLLSNYGRKLNRLSVFVKHSVNLYANFTAERTWYTKLDWLILKCWRNDTEQLFQDSRRFISFVIRTKGWKMKT